MTDPEVAPNQSALIGDLFHALSQPLTSLRCVIEVALLEVRDPEEYRETLQQCLALAEQISVLAAGLRELQDTPKSEDAGPKLALQICLREMAEEFSPLAAAEGKKLLLTTLPESCDVQEAAARRALFLLLQNALELSAADGVITLKQVSAASVQVSVEVHRRGEGQGEREHLCRRLRMALLGRNLTAVGASGFETRNAEQWWYRIDFPPQRDFRAGAKFSHSQPAAGSGKDLPQ